MTHSQSVIRVGYIAFNAISIILLIAGIAEFLMTNCDIKDSKWCIIIAICVAFASVMLRRLMQTPSNALQQPPSKRTSAWLFNAALCFAAVGIALVLTMA